MEEELDELIDALAGAPRAAEVRRMELDVDAMVEAAVASGTPGRRWWSRRHRGGGS